MNVKAVDGRTAWHLAAELGHEDVVQSLLSKEADVIATYTSAIRGTEEEGKFNAGRTPLHRAAVGGHEVAVRMLLDHNADVTIQNAIGRSALQEAT